MFVRKAILPAVCLMFVVFAQPSAVAATSQRLAGPTRYDTAAAIARATFPSTSDAVLASGESFADALAATNMLHRTGYHGPVLLTPRDQLAEATRSYLMEIRPRVFILGGTAAISQHVEDEITAMGLSVARQAGKDRYETALINLYATYNFEASNFGNVDGLPTVLLASGENFADALAAGPLSYAADLPILLTQRDHLPDATRYFFDKQSQGAKQVLILGGTAAISASVETQIQDSGFTVRRLAGSTRQATAVAVADLLGQLTHKPTHVILARGDTYPDALAAGPHGGIENAPILLTTDPNHLNDTTADWLRRNASTIDTLHIAGDDTAITDAVVHEAEAAAG
jgi:putative cell wall-binding protein